MDDNDNIVPFMRRSKNTDTLESAPVCAILRWADERFAGDRAPIFIRTACEQHLELFFD